MEEGQERVACRLRRVLGEVYRCKGEKEEAIYHFETALAIAFPPNFREALFWIHHSLALLFCDEDEFDVANTHIELAKLHAVSDAYQLGHVADPP